MRLYKLTDQNNETYNNTQWGVNVTHSASGDGPLCSAAWIHAYRDPLLAVIMNPVHANFFKPRLWEAEGEVGVEDGTKVGCKSLVTLREIPLPEVTNEQRVRFAILCAKSVYHNQDRTVWAEKWLSGVNCSEARAAREAEWAAREAEWAASAAEWAAREAADTATVDLIAIAHQAIS